MVKQSELRNRVTRPEIIAFQIVKSKCSIRKRVDEAIVRYGAVNNLDPNILRSIFMIENHFRPDWFRKLEWLFYKIGFGVKTFGLMQVSVSHPVTDEESIELAAQLVKHLLKESKSIEELGTRYNGSSEYGKCLAMVYDNIKCRK